MEIGKVIRKRRQELNMSLEQLGEAIGVTAATISRYELGQRSLTWEMFEKIISVLDMQMDETIERSITHDLVNAAAIQTDLNIAEEDREIIFEKLHDLNPDGVTAAMEYVDYLLTRPQYMRDEKEEKPVIPPIPPRKK